MTELRRLHFLTAVTAFIRETAEQSRLDGPDLVNLTADVAAIVAVHTAADGEEMLMCQAAAARLLEQAPNEIAERAHARVARRGVMGRA